METTYRIVDQPGQKSKKRGVFIKYKIIAVVAVVVSVVIISLVILAAVLGRKRSSSSECDNSSGKPEASAKTTAQTTLLSCDVAIVGGGISGLYVAETLLRLQKETNVCLFERDDRFGGRIRDHTFHGMSDITVSLGAWRVDDSHSTVWELLKRFNITASYLAKNHGDRFEARGVFATDTLTLKKKAFPSLDHGIFQNATYQQMMGSIFSRQKEAAKFASRTDFMSQYLTPEGSQFFSHVTGLLQDYDRQFNAEFLFDYGRATAEYNRGNYSRPDSGWSVITRALKMSVTKHGAKLYKNQEIKVIEENQAGRFKLMTTNYTVTAKKLVVAVPPKPMKQIQGSVAEKIQNDSTFQSVGLMEAFKGFAVFEEAWWQLNSTGSRYLADEQEMLSTSDCLGSIFPYKARGPKGQAVLQMSYSKLHCAVKWGELLKATNKEYVDQEMQRALSRLFPGVDIPKPLNSVYMYWEEGAVHMQRAGTHLSMSQVRDWAKRPFAEQDLFIVGEAYHPIRGWIEGALQSAQNALHEGWGIDSKEVRQRREAKREPVINSLDLIPFP